MKRPDPLQPDHGGCLAHAAKRASRTVTALYDAPLRKVGLKAGQFAMLMSVQELESPRIGELSENLGMDRTTTSRNLKPLVREGLLKITKNPSDGRSRIVVLTRKGTRRLQHALPLWADVHREVEQRLGGQLSDVRAALALLASLQLSN